MTLNALMTPPPTTTPTSTVPPPKCVTGWTEINGKCVKVFGTATNDRLDWYQAEEYCSLVGSGTGHLASFTSFTEVTALSSGQNLYNFISSDPGFWIGLNTLDKENGFQWTDKTPFNFANWDVGQPDDFNGAEACVEMKATGKWRDSICYSRKAFFCTIEKGITPAAVSITPSSNITRTNHIYIRIESSHQILVSSLTNTVDISSKYSERVSK